LFIVYYDGQTIFARLIIHLDIVMFMLTAKQLSIKLEKIYLQTHV